MKEFHGQPPVLMAKALGLWNSLKLVIELGISHIEAMVDSLVLVRYFEVTDRQILTLGSMLEDIDSYCRHFNCLHTLL